MKITIEIDDEEVRRVLAPLVQQAPAAQLHPLTRLLKVNEVADRLGVSRNKVYELLYKGEIQSLTIGRTRRVSPVALAEFIARPERTPSTLTLNRVTCLDGHLAAPEHKRRHRRLLRHAHPLRPNAAGGRRPKRLT